jgi:hypothetical protein
MYNIGYLIRRFELQDHSDVDTDGLARKTIFVHECSKF